MRSAPYLITALCFCAWGVNACAEGDSTTDPGDDGPLITGAGGGMAMSSSGTQSTSSSNVTTGGGGMGGTGGRMNGSGGAGGNCVDIGLGEPNESESTAWRLKADPIDDCDGSGDMITGVLAGANDVDWFYYIGDDAFGCVVDPTRTLTQSESGMRICKFFRCTDSNATTVVDCMGQAGATSPGGRDGCCAMAGFEADVNCTGTTDDTSEVYIRLDQPNATSATCNSYTLTYHY